METAVKILIVGLLLMAFGGWALSQAGAVSAIPVRSAVAIQDLPDGRPVVFEGGLDAPAGEHLALYKIEYERCTRDSDGDKSCSWRETGRYIPPGFAIRSGQEIQTPIRVHNSDFSITGQTRYHYPYWAMADTRWQGFQRGDLVLAIGTSYQGGMIVRELYGGTRERYVGNGRLFGYAGLIIGGGLLLVAAWIGWSER